LRNAGVWLTMKTFFETLYEGYGQEFRVDELFFENRTEHQHLVIFRNGIFGRVMALDGIIQTTERDEFIYHEMLTHVPVLAHGNVRRMLIVGGGDGAMLREVTKHRGIEQIIQVEIDREVIETSKRHLPDHSQGAFEDPRVKVIIDDGLHFVQNALDRFDIIISDSTDPIGPGDVLFTRDFYASCHLRLTPGGVFVTQNGVAFTQLEEVASTAGLLKDIFTDWHFFSAAVPTYVGGIMAFTWATDNPDLRHTALRTLKQRYAQSGLKTRYYNPEVHHAAFALPQYVLEAIGKSDNGYR
jgi:spermidine synthase